MLTQRLKTFRVRAACNRTLASLSSGRCLSWAIAGRCRLCHEVLWPWRKAVRGGS